MSDNKIENFENWLFTFDDYLSQIKNKFKDKKGIKLDYTSSSLDVIENWILSEYNTKEELLKDKEILNLLAVYIGETFRKKLGGKWEIDVQDKKSAYYNLPVLKGGKNMYSPIAPHTLATACISRKKGTYISSILDRKIN